MEKFIIRVYSRGEILGEKLEECNTVPRVNDLIEVGDASWTVSSVLWKLYGTNQTRVAVCSFHFGRDSEDAYWTKKEFWQENGFVDQIEREELK